MRYKPFTFFEQNVCTGSFIIAEGGTVTTDGDYKIHTFTSGSGRFIISCPGSGSNANLEVLIVGGGGGGVFGASSTTTAPALSGGSGGAGGLIYFASLPTTVGTYNVQVGNGRATGSYTTSGNTGGNSQFGSFIAFGGEGGRGVFVLGSGNVSGSGGGNGAQFCGIDRFGGSCTSANCGSTVVSIGNQPDGFANDGALATNCVFYPVGSGSNLRYYIYKVDAGGGGGAGGNASGTAGGNGLAYSISGTSITYARGGSLEGGSAGTNTGNGGAGTFTTTPTPGAAGIVIIKYKYQ